MAFAIKSTFFFLLRFALATAANAGLSTLMYRVEYAPTIALVAWQWLGTERSTLENRRITKMNELWPPHEHYLIYIGFTFAIYYLFKYVRFTHIFTHRKGVLRE